MNDSIVQIRLKRENKKKFHGKVFIEFKTIENAEEFLNNYSSTNDDGNDEPKEILSYEGKKLNVFSKKQYDLHREATRSKNFSGSGQRSRSFTGHRKNMPKLTPPANADKESAVIDEEEPEKVESTEKKPEEEK